MLAATGSTAFWSTDGQWAVLPPVLLAPRMFEK